MRWVLRLIGLLFLLLALSAATLWGASYTHVPMMSVMPVGNPGRARGFFAVEGGLIYKTIPEVPPAETSVSFSAVPYEGEEAMFRKQDTPASALGFAAGEPIRTGNGWYLQAPAWLFVVVGLIGAAVSFRLARKPVTEEPREDEPVLVTPSPAETSTHPAPPPPAPVHQTDAST